MTRAKRELEIEKKPLTDATKRSLEYVQIRCCREDVTNLPRRVY